MVNSLLSKKSLTKLVFLFLLISCQSNSSHNDSIPEMEFEVIPSNLGPSYNNPSELTFQVPKGCKLVEEDYSAINYDSIVPYPIAFETAYLDSITKTLVVISDITQLQEKDYVGMQQNPKSFFDTKGEWSEIRTAIFSYKKQRITQFLLQNTSLINIKLVLYEGLKNKYQIDYFVPIDEYSSQARLVESSIGSLEIDKKNRKFYH